MSLQGKVVILAEKPKQATAYVEAFKLKKRYPTHVEIEACDTFPNGATITWAIGHLLELWTPADYDEKWKKWDRELLPIIPSEFRYKVSDSKKAQFNAVKKLFNEADTIVCGTDIDREGSAIFHLIYRHTGAKNKILKRLWINSLEIPAIRDGFNNLRDIEKDLLMFEEANARQMADWLVGMNASRLYGSKLAEKGISVPISVGRVQSVLCWIIYARQLDIENFKPSNFYEVEADFATEAGMYKGRITGRFEDKNALLNMLKKEGIGVGERVNGVIDGVETNRKSSKPPKLHSLSTLQVKANRLWKLNPSEVLSLVQALYEKKIVSYPRSDCQYITDSEYNYLVPNLESYKAVIGTSVPIKNTTANKHFVDSKKVEEHYAIIPTKTIPTKDVLNSLSKEEKIIYTEIVRSTLAMFCGEYIYDETLIETAVNDVIFETVGKTEVDIGFKALWANEKGNDEDSEKNGDKEAEQKLPLVNEDDVVEGIVRIKEGVTSPPKLFTEGQLIQVMKTCGSGKYIEVEESDSDILKSVEGIGTEATRASIIERIKAQQYIEIKRNSVHITPKGRIHCEALRGTMLSSPAITAQWESYLRTIGEGKGRKEEFMNNIIRFVNHLIETVDETFESPQVLSAIQMQVEQSVLGVCPSCKQGKIVDKQAMYGCSEYQKGCKFTLPKKMLKKELTANQIQALLTKGETGLIKGFVSNNQKKFDAKLKLDKEYKIEFIFPKKRPRK
ncbi:DNA topoisomerase III [Lysinibacillus sp. 1P01SD]|uniref:type IA DNA topoisomerase n=1 Tax=Lysinibacillus sp. 1P01SD TaxID=3132285 RepID=UPI0039A16689